jgi:hypothetical protein
LNVRTNLPSQFGRDIPGLRVIQIIRFVVEASKIIAKKTTTNKSLLMS